MGNELSKPEMPQGRSRSLSPLPRDDQFPLEDAEDRPSFPSTMPASYAPADPGSAPLGAPGSLAWHRRRRRSCSLSPESNRGRSRSPSPDDPPLNASQPAQPAARGTSPDLQLRPSTQPARSKPKKSRRPRKGKDGIKEVPEAGRVEEEPHDAMIQESRKRRRRSAAASPFPRDTSQAADESEPAAALDDAASSEGQSQLPKPTRLSERDEGKGKDVIGDAISEEAATGGDRSIFDFDHEPPPSAQPQGKRGRRGSDSKARKKRKTLRSSPLEPGVEDLDSGEWQASVGLGGTMQPQSTALEGHQSVAEASPILPRASTVASQRSHSDSGYTEPDGQPTSALESGMDLDMYDGLPRYEGDHDVAASNGAEQGDNNNMSVASERPGSSVIAGSPSPLLVPTTLGDEEKDNHEEEPPRAPSDPVPTSTPPESASKVPSPRHSAKRKTKVPFFSRQEKENAAAFAELPPDEIVSPPNRKSSARAQSAQGEAGPGPATMASNTKRKKYKRQPGGSVAAEDPEEQEVTQKSQYPSGPLSEAEQNQITRAVERFREDEDLTQQEINQVIHDNPQTSTQAIHRQLWATIQAACPSRPRRKLIMWCRQRFHNFAGRGKWTEEQDDELAELVEKHGHKWSYIGGLINRYPRDVRDRWRNYLVCRDAVKTDHWSEGEEERFRELVEDSIGKIREGLKENSRRSPEELINWQYISEAMGHTRSRLQCMEKWKRIRAAEPLPDQVPTVLPSGSSWRLERARNHLRRITADDKYTLMTAIRDLGVGTDAKIPWKQIVSGTFHGKYERQALVVTWGRLRKAVPDWEWKTTRDCARYLCEMYEREGSFGGAQQGESEEDEDDPSHDTTFTKHRRQKGKGPVRPAPPDSRAPVRKSSQDVVEPAAAVDGETRASGESRQKRGKSRDKAKRDALTSRNHAEPANEDAVMEDQAATQSDASPLETSPQPAVREPSPELGGASPQPSPSVEASAARSKRRERNGSVEGKRSMKGKEKETSPAALKATNATSSKRPRRASLSNGKVDSHRRSKKQKTLESSFASKNKVKRPMANNVDENGESKSSRRSLSVISSDMDDMEDIPARLPA